jgi:hypothetical protein
MALQQLTPEQVRDLDASSRKIAGGSTNVYRGNMPQLTLRSAMTGSCSAAC